MQEEFLAMVLPNKLRRRGLGGPLKSKYELPHQLLTDPARVPAGVDWRGTGADSTAVKDQANCGSCYVSCARSVHGCNGVVQVWWQLTNCSRSTRIRWAMLSLVPAPASHGPGRRSVSH